MKSCHSHCAACCIAPHISSALPNMPDGKPAGVPCVNLDEQLRCRVYDIRPAVCRDFKAAEDSCGINHDEALINLTRLEELTR